MGGFNLPVIVEYDNSFAPVLHVLARFPSGAEVDVPGTLLPVAGSTQRLDVVDSVRSTLLKRTYVIGF